MTISEIQRPAAGDAGRGVAGARPDRSGEPHTRSEGRSNRFRVRGAWLLVAPFVLLADPTPGSWGGGAALALLGLLVRGWAAGCVEKDRRLCVVGPYAFTRNPLYLGSLLLGAGAAIAGRSWLWALLLALLLASSYPRVIRVEETRLAERFGGAFAEYRDRVPRYLPRIRPWRGGGAAEGRFSPRRCLEHREWNAWLGAGACFAWLALLAW